MSGNLDTFIDLDRTFRDLTTSDEDGDEAKMVRLFAREASARWIDLLREPRVILLAEAGSGKTEEIRHICRRQRAEGKPAFFFRIEHILEDFEMSFEEGNLEDFQTWLNSDDHGWLFLDSVDEARLRSPKDFEVAIRRISKRIERALQRTHIVITGRTEAWRPKTDLLLCRKSLPWHKLATAPNEASPPEAEYQVEGKRSTARECKHAPFRIVTLEDLQGSQVEAFAKAKGVADIKAFTTALERAEAWSFTTRPLDLAETVEFWNDNHRIGSRLDLITSSIARRLEEWDQDRAEARPIAADRIREGARLVAAATTLCQEAAIRIPDGDKNTIGIPIKDVLTSWNDQECATLLSRPIFDPGIYGTKRFHHRSVREYLTAEWLHSLLVDEGSRSKIEGLFFREQYGIEVIVPTMRPVLPWLAALDQRICNKVATLAPEVLFEGGDPAALPLQTRRHILRQTCEQVAKPAHGRSMMDYHAVQRFANADLAEDIEALLDQYAANNDITWFLLRMIDQGGIACLALKAKDFAFTSRDKYTRMAAIRAVLAVGTPADVADIRKAFLKEGPQLSRDWLGELLTDLPHDEAAIRWLLQALEMATRYKEYQHDPLTDPLRYLVDALPIKLLGSLMKGLVALLLREPVVEKWHCEISRDHGWLAATTARVALRLIETRDPAALAPSTLSALWLLPIARDYLRSDFDEIGKALANLVQDWQELNHALFWHSVKRERTWREGKKDQPLVDWRHISFFGHYWEFGPDSFDAIAAEIQNRPLLDDRLVALTLAFQIFLTHEQPSEWREQLKHLACEDEVLAAKLDALLHPPVDEHLKFRQREEQWTRRAAQRVAAQARQLERNKALLNERIDKIRDPGQPAIITNDQAYLLEQMRSASKGDHNHWTNGNWRSLIDTYGEPVAIAFRDAAVRFWREYTPKTRSEGASTGETPYEVIFGLTGIAIEAQEFKDWNKILTPTEAAQAARYGLAELNGFPEWFVDLYAAFPDVVCEVILTEILHELKAEQSDLDSHYVLSDIAWQGAFARDQIAPALLPALLDKRINLHNLGHLLSIVQASSVSDTDIAKIAACKAAEEYDRDFTPTWYATWVGVDPDAAIPALTARLASLSDPAEQTNFALRFIVELLGGRRQKRGARQSYRGVTHMKALYLLMAKYIREEEDIQRAGTGTYSPGLRDDAQDARDALFTFIRETPGKEAYLALVEMEGAHPAVRSRPWMGWHAKTKATLDADFAPWKPSQVKEFHDERVSTPTNHRELWFFGVERLEALKHDLEHGDESIASILQGTDKETEFRKYIGGWLRDRARGRYSIPPEEELADAKRPDLRFRGAGFDAPVPVELKVADNWTGPHLFERMEVQLGGDYLRDARSSRGIFLLVYVGNKQCWDLPDGGRAENFDALIAALRRHWAVLASQYPNVEDLAVVGIDLTRRGIDTKTAKKNSEIRKAALKAAKPPSRKTERNKSAVRKHCKT